MNIFQEEAKNLKDPVIFIQQFKKDGDGLFLPKSLKERKPTTIVMYDIDVSAIRQIEVGTLNTLKFFNFNLIKI